MEEKREKWGSHFGFLMSMAGSAIGLGNIWRFPYITGEFGGAAFFLFYLFIVFTFGYSICIAEWAIGRAGRSDYVGSFKKLGGGAWTIVGWFGFIAAFVILSYYSVIAGGYLDELSKKAGMGAKYSLPSYDSKYDNSTYNTRINPGADAKEGVTVTRLQRYASSSQKGELGIDFKECGNGSEGTILGVNCNDWNTTLRMNENDGMNGGNNTNSLYIRSINSGQITEYPFHISEDEDVKISNTHGQYFQLNLDTDSRDMNFDDAVVVCRRRRFRFYRRG